MGTGHGVSGRLRIIIFLIIFIHIVILGTFGIFSIVLCIEFELDAVFQSPTTVLLDFLYTLHIVGVELGKKKKERTLARLAACDLLLRSSASCCFWLLVCLFFWYLVSICSSSTGT